MLYHWAPQMPAAVLSRWRACVLALVCAACSPGAADPSVGGPPSGDPAGFVRLEPRAPLPTEPPAPGARTSASTSASPSALLDVEPGREPGAWLVTPVEPVAGPLPGHPDGPPALVFDEARALRMVREVALADDAPGDAPGGGLVGEVRLLVWTAREIEVYAAFELGGEPAGRTQGRYLRRSDLPQSIALAPEPGTTVGPFDRILVRFQTGRGGALGLARVEVLPPVAPTLALPADRGRARIEAVETERRPAWWLGTGAPLEAPARWAAGAELHGCYRRPWTPPGHRLPAELVVRLRGAAGELLVERRLALEPAGGPEWQRFRIALPGPPGPLPGARPGALPGPPPGPGGAGPDGAYGSGLVELSVEGEPGCDAVCLVSELGLHDPSETPHPDVLLVTTDTHRGDHLGVEDERLSTPALDALAARGLRFTDCFAPANSTNPSHASLMTGTHPRDTGVLDNFTVLSPEAPTLAEAFRDAGYVTWSSVSAGHLQPEFSGLEQGFDRVDAPLSGSRDSSETIAALRRWMDAGDDARPLFVWLHVFDAHTPLDPPDEYRRLYYPEDRDPFDPLLQLPSELIELGGPLADVTDLDYLLAQYRAEVDYLDDQLAPLLGAPPFSEGVVAVVGDHGEGLGEKGVYFRHDGLMPATLHVPLILAWPGAPGGQVDGRPVTHVDLARTLLDLAGLESTPFPGRALWTRAGAPPPYPAEPRFFLGSAGNDAAIQVRDDLLVLHLRSHWIPRGGSIFPRHSFELFDLAGDRDCARDRARDELDRALRMRAALVEWLGEQGEGWVGAASEDADLEAELAALGYTERASSEVRVLTPRDDGCEWCRLVR